MVNVVAQMLCRNEFDVIEETIGEIFRWVDTLVVLDGHSDDGTRALLFDLVGDYAQRGKTLHVTSEPDPGECFADHLRNRLLELTAPFAPDWVISVDADEIYHYDPNSNDADNLSPDAPSPLDAILAAEEVEANVVRCNVPQFWLTFDDLRNGALNEDETISVQKRRKWFSWGHSGTFIWRWRADHYYPADTPKRTPEVPGMSWREWQRAGPLMPVCKHYCFRSLRQALARAEERKARGGRRYFGKYYQNFIIDEQLVGLYHPYRPESWDPNINNHERVYAYMGGRLGRMYEVEE